MRAKICKLRLFNFVRFLVARFRTTSYKGEKEYRNAHVSHAIDRSAHTHIHTFLYTHIDLTIDPGKNCQNRIFRWPCKWPLSFLSRPIARQFVPRRRRQRRKTIKRALPSSNVSNFRAIAYSANLRVIKQIAQVIPSDHGRVASTWRAFATAFMETVDQGETTTTTTTRRIFGRRPPWSRLRLSPTDGHGRLPFLPTRATNRARARGRGTGEKDTRARHHPPTDRAYSTVPRSQPPFSLPLPPLRGTLLNHIRFSRQLFRY